jgi:hypothetical protein
LSSTAKVGDQVDSAAKLRFDLLVRESLSLRDLPTGYGSVLYIMKGNGEPITREIETDSPDAGTFLDIALDSIDGAWISYLGGDSLVVSHVADAETHKFTVSVPSALRRLATR